MDTAQAVQAALAEHGGRPGALLPVLHAVQDAIGHVPADAVPAIARALQLSRAEVHGVLTYYPHFHAEPARAPRLQVCRAEACLAMGGDAVWAAARQLPQCQAEAVHCLGLCASSPAAMLGDRLLARLTPERLAQVVAAVP